MILEFCNITKKYGDFTALDNISFKVTSGRAMAYLGRNGAGKTTSIRALMNVFKPDSGHFLIDGAPFNIKDFRIGYLPEERGLYSKVPILEQLIYFANIRGMDKDEAKQSSLDYLEKVDLLEYKNKELGTLSKGNQQKIQLIQAVIHKPDILILDEPFSGLDPVNSTILQNIVQSYISNNAIVLFSSHQMSLIEEICTDVTFIQKGKIVISKSLNELKRLGSDNKIRLKLAVMNNTCVPNILNSTRAVESYEFDQSGVIVKLRESYTKKNFIEFLLTQNVDIKLFADYEPSLKDIYISYLGDDVENEKGK